MLRILLPFLVTAAAVAQSRDLTFGALSEGQSVSGFRAKAVYLDDFDHAMGARFEHQRTGFTLDLLQIQSVPQTFVWVTTYPTSNMGEPHTQEHLLLGKGNKGRAVASSESMSLVASSAYTQQYRTCYFFNAPAEAIFFDHFERSMDALLHPDYTDEEIRREVRNFGVSPGPNGELRLEEKGTVYNEMVTSMDQANSRLFRAASEALYGPEHPLTYTAGGLPASLRVIQPSDIRKFHAAHYFLRNMGAITALPKDISLTAALGRFDAALNRLEPTPTKLPVMTEAQLPAPQPAPAGRIDRVEYPFRNEQQQGSVFLLWPAERKLSLRDNILLSLFIDNVAGGPDTNLYKRMIDSRTRQADFGAKAIGASVRDDQGNPIFVALQNVPPSRMTDKDLTAIRETVMDELARVAAYADGSKEMAEFHERLRGRILETRRQLAKFVNSPPGFGARFTNGSWLQQITELNKEPGFRKSVTAKEDLAAIEKLLEGNRNIWRERLQQWKVLGVSPYVEAAVPNPDLIRQAEQEREARLVTETARLKEKYGAATEQDALRRYSGDYEAATAELERAAKNLPPPKFLDHPPMTLDDQLEFKAGSVGGIPLVTSTFDSMTSGTTGIALRLDGIPENRLIYVAMLPQLLTRVGVIENGKPVSFEEMTQRMRNEILGLNASFRSNTATDRYELVLRGSGNNIAESKRAIDWMKLVLLHPDWRPENLPRLRDLVDQSLGSLRNTTQSPEEFWVVAVANAYRRQDNPLLLATTSFMTRAHYLLRLRWMLKDGGTDALYGMLARLGDATGGRAERKAVLTAIQNGKYPELDKLSAAEKALAVDAARDLDATLADVPDSSLASDWKYLCNQIATDLRFGPKQALTELDEVRKSILLAGGARMFLIASSATQKELASGIQSLAESMSPGQVKKSAYAATRRVDARLRARDAAAETPMFAGLLNANSQGGVFLNSAPGTSFRDTTRDGLLELLAGKLYAGGGAHGIFMKTWAAGLAYSNGIRSSLTEGQIGYYAERTPELPQTLKFVIEELKRARPDMTLVDYAVAGAFVGTRASQGYEDRGEAMADDLANGITPEVVSRFHRAVLDLRNDPKLGEELFRRMNNTYAKILPGMAGKAKDVKGATYFVIGPEKQLAAYEDYLKKSDAPEDRVWRLYPRDFWQ
jgi:Zn-dependent M16 (insulinase) family peptidase